VISGADNDSTGAMRLYDEACSLLDGVIARGALLAEAGVARWRCDLGKANVLNNEARFKEMAPLLEQALGRGRALPVAADPTDVRPLLESTNLNLLGDARYFLGDPKAALETYKESARVLETALQRRADVRIYDRLAYTLYDIASTLTEMKRHREALGWIERAAMTTTKLRAFEDSSRARHIENIVTLQLAVNLSDLHRYDEAIAAARLNIASRNARADASPMDYEARRALPVGMRSLSDIYFAAGRRREGCATIADTLAAWEALARNGGLSAFDRNDEIVRVKAILAKCPVNP
jgi:tetratricopeptide (TPR) repeat protein